MPEIDENVKDLLSKGRSENTERQYRGDWYRFCKSLDLDVDTNPASPETIASYLAKLHVDNKKPSTITRCLNSISHFHAHHSVNPCGDQLVRQVMRSIRRESSTAPEKAKALRFGDLKRCLDRISPAILVGKRDRALLCIMWFCGLRRSEARSLLVSDIEEQDEGIIVRIRKSKTDQEGEGARLAIPFVPNGSPIDPARIILKWSEYVRQMIQILNFEDRLNNVEKTKDLPLFMRMTTDLDSPILVKISRNPLCDKTISRIIERRLSKVIDITGYSSHSLRAGLITELACSGIEDHRIAAISRHRSYAVLRQYIREGQTWTNNPLTLFFQKASLQLSNDVLSVDTRASIS